MRKEKIFCDICKEEVGETNELSRSKITIHYHDGNYNVRNDYRDVCTSCAGLIDSFTATIVIDD